MSVVQDQTVTWDDAGAARINRLVQRLSVLCAGADAREVEMAALVLYCTAAQGVRQMPEATRRRRVELILTQGSAALVKVIKEVAALDDSLLATMGRTCQE